MLGFADPAPSKCSVTHSRQMESKVTSDRVQNYAAKMIVIIIIIIMLSSS